ncbi:Ig-like domain repeat protein [Aeromicrobium sp. UC242_57]|uniref:Ig-like domain repeat protein n=1 Tax=Aeromicrobium sp. UC242_57 TaxID=3374624 RepID=UPI0037991E19
MSTFVTTSQVETDSTLVAESLNGNKVRLSATVDASSTPEGTVTFKQGSTVLGDPVEVVNGKASTTVLAPAGNHTYTSTFTASDVLAFKPSSSTATVSVKTPSQVTVGLMNPIGAYGSTRLAVVSATVDGESATGNVAVKLDNGASVNVALKNGFGFYTVPGTTALGAHTLTASFAGSSTVSAATASTPLNVSKATTKTSFTLSPAKIKVKKSTKAKVTVTINGASVKPNGLIVIKSGSKVVGSGAVRTVSPPSRSPSRPRRASSTSRRRSPATATTPARRPRW